MRRSRLNRGLVQIYTGSGKGKTTAALGLALRAAGAGLSVYIQQFIKNAAYSEIKALRSIPNISVSQCGRGCFIRGTPKDEDIKSARRGLETARAVMLSGRYDVVILDEANIALKLRLIDLSDITEMLSIKPSGVELVLTGRGCPKSLQKLADLVTEMKCLRHPFNRGIRARKGIEY